MKVGDLVTVPYDSWEDEFSIVGDALLSRYTPVGELGVVVKALDATDVEKDAALDPRAPHDPDVYWHVRFADAGSLWVSESHLEVISASR